jgi:hypothetical protein
MIDWEIVLRFVAGFSIGALLFYTGFMVACMLIGSGRLPPPPRGVPVALLDELSTRYVTDDNATSFFAHARQIAIRWRRYRDTGELVGPSIDIQKSSNN